jgi:hypothetical protein
MKQPARGEKIRRMRSETKLHEKWQATRRGSTQRGLDLSFDIDLAEGRDLCGFEERARLPREEAKPVVATVEEVLAVVIENELGRVGIRFEG